MAQLEKERLEGDQIIFHLKEAKMLRESEKKKKKERMKLKVCHHHNCATVT